MKAWELIKHLESSGELYHYDTNQILDHRTTCAIMCSEIINYPRSFKIIPKSDTPTEGKVTKEGCIPEVDNCIPDNCTEKSYNLNNNCELLNKKKVKLPCSVCAYNDDLKERMASRLTEVIDDICRVRALLRDEVE